MTGAGTTVLDLGSGGGIPGLVLAERFPGWRILLLEGSTRRASWLRAAAASLEDPGQIEVVAERAEVAAHRGVLRGTCSFVVARSFARPATTAECGAGFLRVGGRLVVSEPPSGPASDAGRWSDDGVRLLGLGPALPLRSRGYRYVALECVEPCEERFPRRTGVPSKRPLF